jgi:uncharacterized repeat protein (TIGR03803 family)
MRKFTIAIASAAVVLCGCSRTQSALPIPNGNHQPTQDRIGAPPANPTQYTILHSFHGGDDGITPYGDLLQDSAGNLYGTTFLGGPGNCSISGCGTIYKINLSGKKTILYRFHGGDGYGPTGGLIRDAAGNLYGTTGAGGGSQNCFDGCGVVFKIDSSGNETVLHTFNGTDGKHPSSTLVQDPAGNFYGTTDDGGSSDDGVVFKLDSIGNENVIHSFSGTDGRRPIAGLARDSAGNFYGTTFAGGSTSCDGGCGVVFKIDSSGVETTLHQFNGSDGENPYAGVILDSAGNLYGTTTVGGRQRYGDVYKLDPSGNETLLHTFTAFDGEGPFSNVVLSETGDLYGTTVGGGRFGLGAVYKLDPSGKVTVLHSFFGKRDGISPYSALIRVNGGDLYGTTSAYGPGGDGVVFKLAH